MPSRVEFAGDMYAAPHGANENKSSAGGGDKGNLANYAVYCQCDMFVGFVASLREIDGKRTALCPMCVHMTILKGTSIERVVKYHPRDEAEAKKIDEIREEHLQHLEANRRKTDDFLKAIKRPS
jgi:hypothetical protein